MKKSKTANNGKAGTEGATAAEPAKEKTNAMGEQVKPLTKEERAQLTQCEQHVEKALKTSLEAAKALLEIRDNRLYRGNYSTFEAYLEDRWGMSKAHGYRLIDFANVGNKLSPLGDVPKLETHARLIGELPEDQWEAAWQKVLKQADGATITASMIAPVVEEFHGKQGQQKKTAKAKTERFDIDELSSHLEKCEKELGKVNPDISKIRKAIDKIKTILALEPVAKGKSK